jgi:hypothetical protein
MDSQHKLLHISLWEKVGKMKCDSIKVADVKNRPNYITCYVSVPQLVFWTIYGFFCVIMSPHTVVLLNSLAVVMF